MIASTLPALPDEVGRSVLGLWFLEDAESKFRHYSASAAPVERKSILHSLDANNEYKLSRQGDTYVCALPSASHEANLRRARDPSSVPELERRSSVAQSHVHDDPAALFSLHSARVGGRPVRLSEKARESKDSDDDSD